MRLPFFKSQNTPEKFVVIVLSADAVSSLVVSKIDDQLTLVGKSEQRLGAGVFKGRKIRNWEQALETIRFSLQNSFLQGGQSAKKAFIVLTNGGVISTSLRLRVNRVNPENELSERELKTIFTKIKEKVSQKAKDNLKSGGLNPLDFELLNSEVINYEVDEVKMDSPLGAKPQKLEISLLFRFIRSDELDLLLELLADLKLEGQYFWEEVSLLGLGLLLSKTDGLVINWGLEFTDLCLIKEGRFIGNTSFDLGLTVLRKNKSLYLKAFQVASNTLLKHERIPGQIFLREWPPDLEKGEILELFGVQASAYPLEIKEIEENLLLKGLSRAMD